MTVPATSAAGRLDMALPSAAAAVHPIYKFCHIVDHELAINRYSVEGGNPPNGLVSALVVAKVDPD